MRFRLSTVAGRARRTLTATAVLLSLALLAGCVTAPAAQQAPSDPRAGAGLRYGLAPQPDRGVTFQKDVVLVQGGAASVRSVTADGLTWTLSPNAAGIGRLAPGRVMFLTDRAVGKVRAIRTTSAGVLVTLAPATLTDIIEKGTLKSAKPIPIEDPVVTSTANSFLTDPALQKQAGATRSPDTDFPENSAFRTPRVAVPTVPRPPAAAATVANAATSQTGGFQVTERCCSVGPKLNLDYNKNGLKLVGSAQLVMQHPTADFFLKVDGSTITFSRLLISGGVGLTAHLDGATEPNKLIAGYSPPLATEITFNVPLGSYGGIPLNLVVNQTLALKIDIPGTAVLHVTGKVDLGATLGYRYNGSKFENLSTAKFDADTAMHGTSSIAVGISYATFFYVIRMTVGVGLAGFVVGMFASLASQFSGIVGAPNGIDIIPGAEETAEQCRTVKGSLSYKYGIGYSIPAFVKAVVDSILSIFNEDPIPRSGGIDTGWHQFASLNYTQPKSGFCVKK